ncbi:MAG: hypothetical protein HRT88_10905 [Lentisphaeraceae bacterium]|nr:hypothetical protein [Lentisphaeraceae bacterium]
MSLYDDLRDDLQTGDLVLFSGGTIMSRFIRFFGRSNWSHLGMVVVDKVYDQVLIYQATPVDKIEDFYSGAAKKGVQINALSDVIKKYDGGVAIRQLTNFERTDEVISSVTKFRKEMKDKPFEEDYLEFVKACYDGPFGDNDNEDLSALFCSELVAEAYQRMGILSDSIPSNEYTPKDFSSGGSLDLLQGALSPEYIIKE